MRSMKTVLMVCLAMSALVVNAQITPDVKPIPALQLTWTPPIAREDNSVLAVTEIGGYELRYKLTSALAFSSMVIPNGAAKAYTFSGLPGGDYEFQIAAFDTNGLYSVFVPINYKFITSKPRSPSGLALKKSGVDVLGGCVAPGCKVVKGDGL